MLSRTTRLWLVPWCLLLAGISGSGAQTPSPDAALPPSPASPAPKRSPLATKPDWSRLEAFSGVISREEFDAVYNTFYSDGSGARPAKWKLEPGKVIIETEPGQAPVEIAFRDP